ncbi:MAG: DmpA family aminopeptidase [Candidatus Latescibacterota bacterium]|jgi:D-aminopeptidase
MDRRTFLGLGLGAAVAWPLDSWSAETQPTKRLRLRELGLIIGELEPGAYNAITDVAGVRVGHVTLVKGEGALVVGKGPVRTGVTAILPHGGVLSKEAVYAADFTLNGNGELTGMGHVRGRGLLAAPVLFTNTSSIGNVYDGAMGWMLERDEGLLTRGDHIEPIVGETWGDFLNDTAGRHVKPEHARRAIESAKSGPVAEGCVGGGTAMRAFRFKAGIGTASRLVPCGEMVYTVGVLVQANFGGRSQLLVDGIPVGREIPDLMPEQGQVGKDKSMLVAVATDAPLLPVQLQRLCKRVALGMARTGAISTHGSGDLFLAFSTGQKVVRGEEHRVQSLHNRWISRMHQAVVESTEEAILNSLTMAHTMTGRDGNTYHALPLDRLQEIMRAQGRLK